MVATKSIVRPDYEINILDAQGAPVLVVGCFIDKAGVVDFGIGWDGATELGGVRALLEACSLALTGTLAWMERDDLVGENNRRKSEGDEVPF